MNYTQPASNMNTEADREILVAANSQKIDYGNAYRVHIFIRLK